MVWSGRITYKSQCSGTVATVSAAMWEQKVKGSDIYSGACASVLFWGILVALCKFPAKVTLEEMQAATSWRPF